MGVLEWVEGMRKKPLHEKRRFVAGVTVLIMAVITFIWFVLFFAHFFNELEKQKNVPQDTTPTALPAAAAGSITPPFSQP